ncbi:MAG TPA: bifunctional UDP-N-acetylglucosamine diphosphorylase/glucosamine-1-phosphate N-acetyltransferase GlmU [Arenicellales bacterium]|nr:bifunctional UDP-N-acetylglucosamine diphosphorylase/glucosamine-1-phosphate N-acetyltransferase GlmU [Arenicellales bacterium]
MPLEVIVLAAGEGKRMLSRLSKVLHPLGGVPLVSHVLRSARALRPDRIHVVYGHNGEQVRAAVGDQDINWVHQAEQLGTGHAVAQVLPEIDAGSQVLVLYGDVPLIPSDSLQALCDAARQGPAVLTAVLPDPSGYGRIVRDDAGRVVRIVEERDADPDQRRIMEVNTGFVAAPAERLARWLSRVDRANRQGEYYLTDIVQIAAAEGATVEDVQASSTWDVAGVNRRSELALLEREYQKRRALELADRGVTVLDPYRLDLRGDVDAGRDCVLDANVILQGPVVLGDNVRIGANCVLGNVRVADNVIIHPNTIIEDAVIGPCARIGPFARIRPGTRVAAEAHVGNFVELKNADLAEGAKVNHLSYVGDSSVGAGSNIGAGVITCNYDGARKHRTEIGADAFIGSNSQLVAPVRVGAGATVGAGSTITEDVPDNTLAVSRARQKNIPGWKRPTKT